jgi:hypothetical protein
MNFQIRTLMIKLSPNDEYGCTGNSGIDTPTACCPPNAPSCGGSQQGYEDPTESEVLINDPEGDNDENPAGAAHNERLTGLVLLQQQLRQTLSQAV